jgi:tetratricopeptide (TPR) repeat protein
MNPSRRSVVEAGLVAAVLALPQGPELIGRMNAHTRRIGTADVSMVVAVTERLSDLDDRFGGRHARPMAAAFLSNTVRPYLSADAPEHVRNTLLSATSTLCYLTGYMAVDEGRHSLAQRYYGKALELAAAAGDHHASCTTLRGMSVQAAERGRGAQSRRLADAAATAARDSGPRRRAFFAAQQAHAAALSGDRRSALAHLRDAEKAMDQAESKAGPFGSFDFGALHYCTSQVRYELGDRAGAVEAMEWSVRLREQSTFRRVRVRNRTLLALRQAETGHLDAACATAHQALDEYPHVHSGRVDDSMSRMLSLLRPHLGNRDARALHERALGAGVPRMRQA